MPAEIRGLDLMHLSRPLIDPFAGGVLIISPEPWDAHSVSKHHYAMTLAARGSQVFFLNPPDSSLDAIHIQTVSNNPRLYIVTAPRVAAGLRFYPSALRCWIEGRWLSRLEKATACKINVVWLFENSRFFDMRLAGRRLKIYHQVDLNQDFHPQRAARSADICFCTSDFIKQVLLPFNSRVYKIHHGLALAPVSPPMTEEQVNRFKGNVPHAIYIGNLEMAYLDIELFSQLVNRFTGVKFHFVGGFSDDGHLRVKTLPLPNVVWWGKVNSTLIPAILDYADILLVAYQAKRYRDQSSPHKFMEYLASGKTVVTTYTDEYKDKRHLLEMVDDSIDYLAAFDRVVSNLADYNSPERQAARKAFAQAHTYEKQLDKIIDLLKQSRLIAC